MMVLVDAGNSGIKWGTLKRGKVEARGAFLHVTADLDSALTAAWQELERPERVVVANVAGEIVSEGLRDWCEAHWSLVPQEITAEAERFGVTNAYLEPARLGVDRWAALVAARESVKGAVCIVDCGTAVTLDVMDGEGRHLGGLIIPGLAMMRRALSEQTQGIGRVEEGGEVALLGRDTAAAVNGGTLYALVAAIDRITADLAAELPAPLTRLLAGGDAVRLLPLLRGGYRHESDLVLQGLGIIAKGTKR